MRYHLELCHKHKLGVERGAHGGAAGGTAAGSATGGVAGSTGDEAAQAKADDALALAF